MAAKKKTVNADPAVTETGKGPAVHRAPRGQVAARDKQRAAERLKTETPKAEAGNE